MKTISTFLISFLIACPLISQDSQSIENLFGSFLSNYVEKGKVDYASIDEDQLNILLEKIGNYKLTSNRNQDLSFYLNAYNIITIGSICKNGIPSSPLNVSGFFDQQKHLVAGQMLTLNDIENSIIRPTYKDPRIHFGLVCGALGCPKIYPEPFEKNSLEDQLNYRTKKAINDAQFIQVKSDSKQVLVSEIFKWYLEDFADSKESLVDFINPYRENQIPKDFSIDYYSYDWTVNAK